MNTHGLEHQVENLFQEQIRHWELARVNFDALKGVRVKMVDFGRFQIYVQFNPARLVSSNAKVDAKTIAHRACFLCESNRPSAQQSIAYGDYSILINPFPIFPKHLTIPRCDHEDQRILPYFADMLNLARDLPDYVIFYNGPECGASAPDHMHFQAGNSSFLPLISDYARLKQPVSNVLYRVSGSEIFQIPDYLRTVVVIESSTTASATESFSKLYTTLQGHQSEEPMMNVVCHFHENQWYTFVLPRARFRPWQYHADDDSQLLVSPATVEMSGVFITPIQSHFERITKEDISDILSQSTLKQIL